MPEPTEDVSREELLEAQIRELAAQARRQRADVVQDERVLEEIRTALESPPPKYRAPKLPAKQRHRGHAQALLLSDTHAWEVVDREAMDGLGEYNEAIMQARLANIQVSLASYRDARPYPIEELQLWVLGDMVSGDIHDELTITNERPIIEQAFYFGCILGQWIEELVPHYPKIVVYGVPGNHARLTKKMPAKQVANSYDWLAYKIAENHLRNYDSVTCHFPKSERVVAEIAGLKYLLWHGHGVRTTMPGVPWGGVQRRWKELHKEYLGHGIVLDGLALGHFHQANAVDSILMNGSVIGPNEWSVQQFGSGQEPTQLLVTFDPKRRRRTDVSYINP